MDNIFQLNDSEGESYGMINTNVKEDTIQKEWSEYVKNSDDWEDFGVDEFIERMESKYPEFEFHRFFINAEINP